MFEFLIASLCGTAGVALALLLITLILLRHKSQLIFGIYPRKGLFYHLKYTLALLVLKYLRHKIYHQKEQNDPNYQKDIELMDGPQVLCDNPKSYDVVSFMAANVQGQKLMITLERRRRGINKACIYVWLPEYGLLVSPKLPDMLYFTTDGNAESTEFKGNGYHILCKQPMKLWAIHYVGELKQVSEDKLLNIKLDLEFSSFTSHFDYNRDLSPSVIADSIAREAWNESFYIMIKNVDKILDRRVHYEQSGQLKGQIEIRGQEGQPDAETKVLPLNMNGFRDHSFGTERCLSTINRYVYFALFLEDGSSMVVGNLSQPSFFLSSLKVGYICSKEGVYQPITKCNFELYSYGQKGIPPKHQNFIVHTEDLKYFVQIKCDDTVERYNGSNWESKIFNQFVSCTVNGIPGKGITEYMYRHNGGRPESVWKQDPQWYQHIRKFERNLSSYENVDDTEEFFF